VADLDVDLRLRFSIIHTLVDKKRTDNRGSLNSPPSQGGAGVVGIMTLIPYFFSTL
jgi:hypothetical protein